MKKICLIVLVICLAVGTQVFAVENADDSTLAAQEIPQGGMPNGERGMQPPPEGVVIPRQQMPGEQEPDRAVPAQNEMPPFPGDAAENPWKETVGQRMQNSTEIMPGEMQNQDAPVQTTGIHGFLKTYSTSVVAVVLLAAAFVFVKVYKRKEY